MRGGEQDRNFREGKYDFYFVYAVMCLSSLFGLQLTEKKTIQTGLNEGKGEGCGGVCHN